MSSPKLTTAILMLALLTAPVLPALPADEDAAGSPRQFGSVMPDGAAQHRFPPPGQLADAGDRYFTADGRSVRLLRSESEVAVRFSGPLTQAQGVQALRGRPGVPPLEPLASAGFAPGGRTDILRPIDRKQRVDPRAVAASSSVVFAYPVLVDPDSGCRMIPTDEVLIRVRDGFPLNRLVSAIRAAGLEIVEQTGARRMNIYLLRLVDPKKGDALEASRRLAGRAGILWAEPNFIREMRFGLTPNDPMFSQQQNMHNTGQNGGTSDADADAPEAWDTHTGDSSVVIAIIDDGVDTGHTDLSIHTNPGESGSGKETNGVDDDANGKIDDWHGWDFAGSDNDPNPAGDNGHGTACAGVAAAKGNNSTRMAGMAYNCKVFPVKVASDSGAFTTNQKLGEAISYAADFADVLSNSWGGGSSSSYISDAVDDANDNGRGGKGCPVLFSTGNEASRWMHGGPRFRYNVGTDLGAGTYSFGFRYSKDALGSTGEDLARIDNVVLLDGDGYTHLTSALGTSGRQDFEGTFPPTGWTRTSSTGTDDWLRSSVGTFTGTGGSWSAESASILHGQWTELQTPEVTLAGDEILAFACYISSEASFDGLRVRIYDDEGAYVGQYGLICGNETVSTAIHYPSSLATTYSNVCAVGASTDRDLRSDYSCYGTGLDFVASSNGGWNDIATLDPTGTVGWTSSDFKMNFGGTSSACPLAAGTAALLLSVQPELTATEVREILRNTCDKIGGVTYTNGWNQFYGYGRVNAWRVTDDVAPSLPTSASESHGAVSDVWQSTVPDPAFTWSGASDPRSGIHGYYYYWGTDSGGTSTNYTTSAEYDPPAVSTGTYYLRVQTRDNAYNTSSWGTKFTFKYDGIAPSNPTNASEAGGAQNNVWQSSVSDPDFNWWGGGDTDSGVAGYYYYWGTDPNGTSGNFTATTNYNPTPVPDGTYYLRVQTKDNAGNVSSWTTLFVFKYDGTPPNPPISCTETHGVPNNVWQSSVSDAEFTWSGATDATSGIAGYYYYFGTDSGGTSTNWTTAEEYDPSSVSSGAYYVRVQSKDNAGNKSGWLTLFTFKYDALPPNNPDSCIELHGVENGVWQNSVNAPMLSWSGASDPHSGIDGYYYYFGTSSSGEPTEWTSATQISPAEQTCGTYYLRIKTKDYVGNVSSPETIFVFKYDGTPPDDFAPAADPSGWTSAATVEITFATSDTCSGIDRYEVAVDTGGYSERSSPYALDVSEMSDGSHTVHLKAFDNAGNVWGPKDVSIYLDKSPPTVPLVDDFGAFTTDTGSLHGFWAAEDFDSSVTEYRYAISTTKGTEGIIPGGGWQNVTAQEDTRTGLSLVYGQLYYILAKAKNAAGLWGDFGVSDAIASVQIGPVRIPDVKHLPDDMTAGLALKVVTAIFGTQFYVQDPDTRTGLLVMPVELPNGLLVGESVEVGGTLDTTADDEHCISNAAVTMRGGGAFEPVYFMSRFIGGGDWWYNPMNGAGQRGVKDSLDLNNIGLLVCTTGRVTMVGSNYFYLDDGAGLQDDSGEIGIKVVVPDGCPLPAADDYVRVTGISSCFKSGADLYRMIRVRSDADIQIMD